MPKNNQFKKGNSESVTLDSKGDVKPEISAQELKQKQLDGTNSFQVEQKRQNQLIQETKSHDHQDIPTAKWTAQNNELEKRGNK